MANVQEFVPRGADDQHLVSIAFQPHTVRGGMKPVYGYSGTNPHYRQMKMRFLSPILSNRFNPAIHLIHTSTIA
jgi:hypothetical protein